MDTSKVVMPIIDGMYEAAADEGTPKVAIIPNSPILAPVDPKKVASGFPFNQMLAVCVAADGLVEIYMSGGDAETVRKVARELETAAGPETNSVHNTRREQVQFMDHLADILEECGHKPTADSIRQTLEFLK